HLLAPWKQTMNIECCPHDETVQDYGSCQKCESSAGASERGNKKRTSRATGNQTREGCRNQATLMPCHKQELPRRPGDCGHKLASEQENKCRRARRKFLPEKEQQFLREQRQRCRWTCHRQNHPSRSIRVGTCQPVL